MDARSEVLGLLAMGVAAVALMATVPFGFAGQAEETAPAMEGGEAQIPVMDHLKCMTEMKALLKDAKAAVQAGQNDKAIQKLDAALALIETKHKEMHDCMQKCCDAMKKKMEAETDPAKKARMQKKLMERKETKCPMCKPGVCNKTCPMTGKPLDPDNVPESLTRRFKDKKVGFCCPACPPAWDKLSDEQKQEKLDKALAKPEAQ
jgi:hypothetical protein